MKKYYALLLLLLIFKANAQQEVQFNFGHIFKAPNLNDHGKLYLVGETEKDTVVTVGSFTVETKEYVITNKKKVKENTYTIRDILHKLRGVASKRNKDTLFIKFWDITKDVTSPSKVNIVTSTENDCDFIYVIEKWDGPKPHFNLPYRYGQLLATNIPFRVLSKTGNLESDFLNANASYVWVKGRTKIFKSEFVPDRNSYYAVGPYLGLSAIDNPVEEDKKEFGLNYGVNIVGGMRGFNIIIAYGFQNGFKTETREVQPYLGFGIGFNLLETFSPEIEKKED